MSTEDHKDAAHEHADRAARQVKHAARNTANAAEHGAEYLKDEAVETVENAADAGKRLAGRLNPDALAYATRQLGWGFVAMSVSVYTGAIAANKFKAAFDARSAFTKTKNIAPHLNSNGPAR